MIDDLGEIEQVIRLIKDPETQEWALELSYHVKEPAYAGRGEWHLPWNGSMISKQVLHREPYKTREQMVMDWLLAQ